MKLSPWKPRKKTLLLMAILALLVAVSTPARAATRLARWSCRSPHGERGGIS
jgi:hypothetical protein